MAGEELTIAATICDRRCGCFRTCWVVVPACSLGMVLMTDGAEYRFRSAGCGGLDVTGSNHQLDAHCFFERHDPSRDGQRLARSYVYGRDALWVLSFA